MSAATVAGILTQIPWKEIFQHGPTLLNSAKGLFDNSKKQNAKESLEERVERLIKNEKEQAQLIEQLVERQELFLSTIRVINSRLKVLFICTIAAVAGLASCFVILLTK
jgi:hypothetical protein